MRVEKREGSDERKVITAMITDRAVLGRITPKWQDDLFQSRWANTVGDWCVDYFKRYDKAPKQAIEGIFENWAEKAKDKDTIKLVDKFLAGLSDAYKGDEKDNNSAYVCDMAGRHFNRVRLRRLSESIQGDLDGGDIDRADERASAFQRVEMRTGASLDFMQDQEAMRRAFESKAEPIVKYKGALGKFFGPHLERDGLIAFMGPEKRGKSWWLLDVTWRAMLQRRKVAFFSVGDMSEEQVNRRLCIRAARAPLKAGVVKMPTHIEHEFGAPMATVENDHRTFDSDLGWRESWKACQTIIKRRVKTDEPLIRIEAHPNSSLSVKGIRAILEGWERDGWVPDVIVIDYADILAMPDGGDDQRNQINATWKQLRALSQSLHCLVVTATQADARSYDVQTIRANNFTDDKRKLAHVTGLIGINQNQEEKEHGIQRLNWVVLREGEFSEAHCVHVAGCLAIGNPAVKSTF